MTAKSRRDKNGRTMVIKGMITGSLSLPFPATAPFSQITRSYFRVPFTYASSLLESLEQATSNANSYPALFKGVVLQNTKQNIVYMTIFLRLIFL